MDQAVADAHRLGHEVGAFELDAYDPADPESKPDSAAARCRECQEILALDLAERPYRFGRGWIVTCEMAKLTAWWREMAA